jgi:hypothetical protein
LRLSPVPDATISKERSCNFRVPAKGSLSIYQMSRSGVRHEVPKGQQKSFSELFHYTARFIASLMR